MMIRKIRNFLRNVRNFLFGTPFIESKDPMKWVRLTFSFSDKQSDNCFDGPIYNKKRSEKYTKKIQDILKNK